MHNHQSRPERKATTAPPQPRGGKPNRILVVHDESGIRELNTMVLREAGYLVDAAADGAAGWESLRVNHYDLVISDAILPKVTGFQMIEKMRAAHMAVPVIMATDSVPTTESARSSQPQPTAPLLEPYTVDELLEAVKEVLRMADDARRQFRQ